MPQFSTSKHFQRAQQLAFCYLCCEQIETGQAQNRDHVPPRAVFLESDRNPALWLPTHQACNSKQSERDDKIGQLIGLLHKKAPSNPNHRLLLFNHELGAVDEINIEDIVFRWVRGLHAALYQQPLGGQVRGVITTPFVPVNKTDGTPLQLNEAHFTIVQAIKRNRAAGRLDAVYSSNGKFKYQCVWGKSGDGAWCCMFAIDLYDWKDLGHSRHGPARGCCGYYFPSNGQLPQGATIETPILVPFSNVDKLDPFGA